MDVSCQNPDCEENGRVWEAEYGTLCPVCDEPMRKVKKTCDCEALRAALEAVEWHLHSYIENKQYCLMCLRPKDKGHAPDCIVGKALKRKGCE